MIYINNGISFHIPYVEAIQKVLLLSQYHRRQRNILTARHLVDCISINYLCLISVYMFLESDFLVSVFRRMDPFLYRLLPFQGIYIILDPHLLF